MKIDNIQDIVVLKCKIELTIDSVPDHAPEKNASGESVAGKTRLNLVLPGFLEGSRFGGVSSALDLTGFLSTHYDACRLISLYETPDKNIEKLVFPGFDANPELFFLNSNQPLVCHKNDVFMITYWKGMIFWEELHKARLARGLPPLPFYYFIQDYEPGFASFGAEHAMSLRTYSFGQFTHAIINSEELGEHLRQNGHSFAREYILKPSLNKSITAFLQGVNFKLPPKKGEGEKTIIVFYGRPGLPRNCFETGIETLKLFFETLSPAGRARFLAFSAGLAHEDISLAKGVVLKSLGRLSIEEYITLLVKAHVGLSLMISPHPSYPPLEMALFGMPTVTTDYGSKKMNGVHPLLLSAAWPDPAELANLLRRAVAQAEKLKGSAQRIRLPSSFSSLNWQENFAALNIHPILPISS